jgi:hypothetical protein
MAVQPEQERAPQTYCWCCGSEFAEAELVHLGQHPEVGVCLRCTRWLQRRAAARYDKQHPTPTARLRAVIHAARAFVIRKGWHEHRVLGALLRRMDRHLP